MHKTQFCLIEDNYRLNYTINRLMLFRETLAVYCKNPLLCKMYRFLYLKAGGTYSLTLSLEGLNDVTRFHVFYRDGISKIAHRIHTASLYSFLVGSCRHTIIVEHHIHSQIYLCTVCRFFTNYAVDDIRISRSAISASISVLTYLIMTIASVFQTFQVQLRWTAVVRLTQIHKRSLACVIISEVCCAVICGSRHGHSDCRWDEKEMITEDNWLDGTHCWRLQLWLLVTDKGAMNYDSSNANCTDKLLTVDYSGDLYLYLMILRIYVVACSNDVLNPLTNHLRL